MPSENIIFEPIFPGANTSQALSVCCHEPVRLASEEDNSPKEYARCSRCMKYLKDADASGYRPGGI